MGQQWFSPVHNLWRRQRPLQSTRTRCWEDTAHPPVTTPAHPAAGERKHKVLLIRYELNEECTFTGDNKGNQSHVKVSEEAGHEKHRLTFRENVLDQSEDVFMCNTEFHICKRKKRLFKMVQKESTNRK